MHSLQKTNAASPPIRYKGIGLKKGMKKYWMLYVMMILPLTQLKQYETEDRRFILAMLLGTAAAAWINGKAGELAQQKYGSVSMVAGDTVASIAEAIRSASVTE